MLINLEVIMLVQGKTLYSYILKYELSLYSVVDYDSTRGLDTLLGKILSFSNDLTNETLNKFVVNSVCNQVLDRDYFVI